MKFHSNNKYFKWGFTAFLTICAAALFIYFIYNHVAIGLTVGKTMKALLPLLFGFSLAYLLTPVLNFFEYSVFFPICIKLKIKKSKKCASIVRAISVTLTTVLFVVIIGLIIALMISQVVPSVTKIAKNYSIYYSNIYNWVNQKLDDNVQIRDFIVNILATYSEQIRNWINDYVIAKSTELVMRISLSVVSALKVFKDFIIGLIIAIYFMANKEKISAVVKKIAYSMWEVKTANIFINNLRFAHKNFINFFVGKIVDSIIIGIICFIATAIMHTPYYALISIIVGVTNIIPFFGPFLGAIPSAILIFIDNPMQPMNLVYFLIMILILQQVDGNLIGPIVLGDSTGLSSLWVIFSITFFGGIWGVFGMFIAVPLFAILYGAVKSIVETSLKRREMPTETFVYQDTGFIDDEGNIVPFVADYKLKKRDRKKSIFGARFIGNLTENVNDEEFLKKFEREMMENERLAAQKKTNKLMKKIIKKEKKNK